jgi:tRNA (cytidine/uridine-2'-O-)-methyltransferase
MKLDVVLVNPQIPQNTGSIARTCAALICPLYIVGKPAFEITEKKVRRAGLDYWPYVNLTQLPSLEDYKEKVKPKTLWYISKFGTVNYYDANFAENDALVFGSETTGLGEEILSSAPKENILRIPMHCKEVRSLNLSNATSIVLYEAMRKIGGI